MTRLLVLLLAAIPCLAQAHSVTLTWNWAQAGGQAADGFDIYRSASASGPFTLLAAVGVMTLVYIDGSAAVQTSGTSFWYYVTAFNSSGQSAPSNTVMATIPFVLSPPGALSVTVK